MTNASPALSVIPSREDLVDEFSELDRQVQQFKPKADRHKELKDEIKGWYDGGYPAEAGAIAKGHKYEIQVSAKSKERTWTSMFKLYRALGRDVFLAGCEFALGKAEKLLGEAKVAALVTTAQTGSRRLKPVLKAPVETAA